MANRRKLIQIGLAVLVGAFVVRVCLLYYNTTQLVAVSDKFPHEYSVGNGPNKLTYLALGDSTVQGAGCDQLEETIPYMIAKQIAGQGFTVHVINRGVVGAKISDVEQDQLDKIDSLKADFITLNIGSNDATHFTDYAEFSKQMTAVLTKITQNPSTVVSVANTPDLSLVPAIQPVYSGITEWRGREQNKVLENIVTGSSVHIVDLYTNGKLAGSDNYASDDFHPSPKGYAKWADLFKPVTDSIAK